MVRYEHGKTVYSNNGTNVKDVKILFIMQFFVNEKEDAFEG